MAVRIPNNQPPLQIQEVKLMLPTTHSRQKEILDSNARFRVVASGRRFGKTTVGERVILIRAAQYNHTCWWVAPTYQMAGHVWRHLKSAVRNLPDIRINESDLRMEFPGGGSLEVRSTFNPDHLRGAGLDFVVLDEAAFMPPDIWPEIVRPMLLERQGGALFLSSPNGKNNWFYHLYLMGLNAVNASSFTPRPDANAEGLGVRVNDAAPALPPYEVGREQEGGDASSIGLDKGEANSLPMFGEGWGGVDTPLWHAFHFPTRANPLISADELAAIQHETPERIWRSEYLAEFTDDLGQVFRGIREAATAPLHVQPRSGGRYVFGVDWGREGDYTAIVVLDADSKAVVALDHFNQINWSLQRGRLRALYEHWSPLVIYAEANSIGSPNIEALQAEGLPVRPFQTTASSKPALIEALALAIERREIALMPHETLLGELSAYAMGRLPAGGYRYSAPAGLHDDLVIATALAWHASRYGTTLFSFV